MAKKEATLIPLESAEQWDEIVMAGPKLNSWCGPCENMIPTYNLLLRDVEECESRINFVTADRANFAEQLTAMIPKEAGIDIKTHGCEPLLLFIKGGKTVHYVKGANAGEVSRTAKEHLPPIGTDED